MGIISRLRPGDIRSVFRVILLLLVTAMVVRLSTCSMLIAQSGYDLTRLWTRDDVHKEFGEPVATGTVKGFVYEDYRSRRKIAERRRAHDLRDEALITLGIAELIAFPRELFLLCRRAIFGEHIRFVYDGFGHVNVRLLDGEDMGTSHLSWH